MTYGELKTLVQQYLENEETSFVANLGQFVILAEEEIYRQVQIPDLKKLVTDTPATLTASTRTWTLPTDYLSTYSFAIDTGSGSYVYLINKEQSYLRAAYPDSSVTGTPRFYAQVDDTTFALAPIPDSNYSTELHYFYKPTSLSAGGDSGTTWLSENAENALLFGTIFHGYIYEKGDQDVIAQYQEKFTSAIADLRIIMEGRERKDTYRKMDKRIDT
jgi:hypothetical protein